MHVLKVLFHEWGEYLGYNLTKKFSAKRLCTTQHAVLFTSMISLRNKVVIELEEYFDKICIKETNSIFRKYRPSSAICEPEILFSESLGSSCSITIQKRYSYKLFLPRTWNFHYNQEISWDLKTTYWRILKFNKTTTLNSYKKQKQKLLNHSLKQKALE